MAIPDFQSIMLPLLQYAGDGEERSLRATIKALADGFELSEEERRELLPSGAQPVFDNRVSWARTYLKKAGLLTATRHGYAKITPRGKEVLAQEPDSIDTAYLMKFDEFVAFRTRSQAKKDTGGKDKRTPEEVIEEEFRQLRQNLADELLEAIKAQPPDYFERLVIDLLVAMGYGGSRRDAGQAVGRSGDGGIDGIINQDRLGLDVIYVQAKRWQGTVGSPELLKFAGALAGKKAKRGVFLTTSTFSQQAIQYAQSLEAKIILIDGDTLAQLMIDHGIGVTTTASYEVKRIDADYFAAE
ncbi:MAG: restriction endonuclease [Anaerolineae bacterium]